MNTKVEEHGNEHANPHMHIEDGVIRIAGGLTIREHFAGLILPAIAKPDNYSLEDERRGYPKQDAERQARAALRYADALIAALNQEQAK